MKAIKMYLFKDLTQRGSKNIYSRVVCWIPQSPLAYDKPTEKSSNIVRAGRGIGYG